MTGRQEKEAKIENKIKDYLKDSPSILTNYYYYLSNNTVVTKDAYLKHIIRFLKYIEYDGDDELFRNLKPSDINRYIHFEKEKQNSQSWIANNFFAVKNFFSFLVLDGYIDINICDAINPPKVKTEKELVYMTEEEIQEVKNNIEKMAKSKWKNRDLGIFLLGCGTGLRVSAICNINVEDIDYDNGTVLVIEKGDVTKTCKIPDKAMEVLIEWKNDREKIISDETPALFVSQKKNRVSVSCVEDILKKYTKTLGKKITPHKMRSTLGEQLYEHTGDIYLVASILGHKNIKNTMCYAKPTEKKKEQAMTIANSFI